MTNDKPIKLAPNAVEAIGAPGARKTRRTFEPRPVANPDFAKFAAESYRRNREGYDILGGR